MKVFMKTTETTFEQDSDCCSTGSQYITVKIEDGGGGPYAVIETGRWALDANDIDVFCENLKQLIKDCE